MKIFYGTSLLFFLFFFLLILPSGCMPEAPTSEITPLDLNGPIASLSAVVAMNLSETPEPTLIPTSTPKPKMNSSLALPTHPVFQLDAIPTLRLESVEYEIKEGDTISKIATTFQVSKKSLIEANNLINPDIISVGQKITIPPQTQDIRDKGFLILPDAELVYGPPSVSFQPEDFLSDHPKSYLSTYLEPTPTPLPKTQKDSSKESPVRFTPRTGMEILFQVSAENSINPKVLLALMEFQSASISNSKPNDHQKKSVIAYLGKSYESLSRQLNWAADTLNYGYYQWKNKRINQWILDDDTVVAVNNNINAGTAAIQYLFSQIYGKDDWVYAVSEFGFAMTYRNLFGIDSQNYSWENTPESFPDLQLPFSAGEIWSFTSGPHYGWSSGTPWSALDFAPPDAIACSQSNLWVTASAPGKIVYSKGGLVIEDLDEDSNMQTGWSILYLHIEERDRIETGRTVESGDKIGHASCEGGIADGSHVHIARRYNGEWVPIDAKHPLILSGWEAFSTGSIYDGYLVKDDKIVEAWYYKTEESEISY